MSEARPFEQACPRNEISDLTMPDGRTANVRILKVGDTLLYVPLEWLRASSQLVRGEQLVSDRERKSGEASKSARTAFRPEIHEFECPGIVHTASNDISGYNEIRLFFRKVSSGEFSSPLISQASLVDAVYITNGGSGAGANSQLMANDEDWSSILNAQASPRNGQGWHRVDANTFIDNSDNKDDLNPWFIARTRHVGGASASQWVLPDVMLRYNAPIEEADLSRWRSLRPSIRRLGEWLATPPAHRENQKTFLLGERQ